MLRCYLSFRVKKSKRKGKKAKRRAKKRAEQSSVEPDSKSLLLKRIRLERTQRHMVENSKARAEREKEKRREEPRKARGLD